MKPVWILVFVASLAGLEFLHEFASHGTPGVAMCMAPEAGREAVRDALWQHMQTHR